MTESARASSSNDRPAALLPARHEHDVLAWAEQQAELLSRLAAGEGEAEGLDWAHVIEEVRDVGLSELRACESLLQQAMTHLLKLHAWPSHQASDYWQDEAGAFLDDAKRRFTPSMRRRIDLGGLFAAALRRARSASIITPPRAFPDACPFSLDALLDGDLNELLEKLEQPSG